jgi:hypothetical protein
MPQLIRGKSPVLLKVVFELKYRQGYTYLDRCGRTINTIQEYHPDWVVAGGQPTLQSGSMLNVETGTKFNFSALALDRPMRKGELDAAALATFAQEAEDITGIVIDQLGLAQFSRIGCRAWYLFPTDSEAEAKAFLQGLNLFHVSPPLVAAFGGELEHASASVTFVGADRKYKVSFDVVERTIEIDLGEAVVNVPIHTLPSKERHAALVAQGKAASRRKSHPPNAAMIDIDASREDPAFVKPREFVLSSLESALAHLHTAVDKSQGGPGVY